MRSQDFNRSQRVADQIRRELAILFVEEVSDPRLQGATISGVDLSADMRVANVFVTLPGGSDAAAARKALVGVTGRLRHLLAQRMSLRHMPELRFEHDTTLDRVDRIEQLLRDARAKRT